MSGMSRRVINYPEFTRFLTGQFFFSLHFESRADGGCN